MPRLEYTYNEETELSKRAHITALAYPQLIKVTRLDSENDEELDGYNEMLKIIAFPDETLAEIAYWANKNPEYVHGIPLTDPESKHFLHLSTICGTCGLIKTKIRESQLIYDFVRYGVYNSTKLQTQHPLFITTVYTHDEIDSEFGRFLARVHAEPSKYTLTGIYSHKYRRDSGIPLVEDDSEGYWLYGVPYILEDGIRKYILLSPPPKNDGDERTNLTSDDNLLNYFSVFDEGKDQFVPSSVKVNGDFLPIDQDAIPVETQDDLTHYIPDRRLLETLRFVVPPPGSKRSIFAIGWKDFYVNQIFSGAETRTLSQGTIVYHGSKRRELDLQNLPLWVTTEKETAERYSRRAENGLGHLHRFVLKRPVTLYYFKKENILKLFNEIDQLSRSFAAQDEELFITIRDSILDYAFPQVDPLKRRSTTKIDKLLSFMICMTGYDGYFAEKIGGFHAEIMLCDPSETLSVPKVRTDSDSDSDSDSDPVLKRRLRQIKIRRDRDQEVDEDDKDDDEEEGGKDNKYDDDDEW